MLIIKKHPLFLNLTKGQRAPVFLKLHAGMCVYVCASAPEGNNNQCMI